MRSTTSTPAQNGCIIAACLAKDEHSTLFMRLGAPVGHDTYIRISVTFGIEGSTMSDGNPTPKAHDGMAAFRLENANIRLIGDTSSSRPGDLGYTFAIWGPWETGAL
jgi:hypothetical protein